MIGQDGGDAGPNDDLFRERASGIGATIMGRNMFGPVRGPWLDETWRGWWGEQPPFDHDVFVLTHYPRPDLVMSNATRFHFVHATPREVLDMATEAARGDDVLLAGGTATIQQFLRAGLVDDMHLAIAPVLLGDGERLFEGVNMGTYSCTPLTCAAGVAHVHVARMM